MKNKLLIIFTILSIILLLGCSVKTNNEIYNSSYDVNVDIEDIQYVFTPAVEKATEASIGVSLFERRLFLGDWQLKSTGSGVVYKGYAMMKDGSKVEDIATTKNSTAVDYYVYYALTNEHVIGTTAAYSAVKVFLADLNLYIDATILGKNIIDDIAVIKFETSIYITPIKIADSDKVKKGEMVIAIGNPEGYQYYSSVTFGIVSFPKRYVVVERDMNGDDKNDWSGSLEYIQHDAAINPGSSGGALVNINGELIGINTMKSMDDVITIEGLGFAIPANRISSNLYYLENGIAYAGYEINATLYSVNEIRNRDFLSNIPNINLNDNYTYEYGIYVSNLKDNSINLKNGDIIMEINNEKLYSVTFLSVKLHEYQKNDKILLKVFRDNEILEFEQTLR